MLPDSVDVWLLECVLCISGKCKVMCKSYLGLLFRIVGVWLSEYVVNIPGERDCAVFLISEKLYYVYFKLEAVLYIFHVSERLHLCMSGERLYCVYSRWVRLCCISGEWEVALVYVRWEVVLCIFQVSEVMLYFRWVSNCTCVCQVRGCTVYIPGERGYAVFQVSEQLHLCISDERLYCVYSRWVRLYCVHFRWMSGCTCICQVKGCIVYIPGEWSHTVCFSGEACGWCGGVAGKIARLGGSHTQRTQCWRRQRLQQRHRHGGVGLQGV